MRDTRWQLLLVTDDTTPVRQVSVRPRTLYLTVGCGAVLGLLFVGLFATIGVGVTSELRALHLERKNAVLSEELKGMRARIGELEGSFAELAERDRHVRALAGLDALDDEVMEVGIGGPGTPDLETHPLWSVDVELGAEAFAIQYDLNAMERRARLLNESLAEASDSLMAHRDLLERTPSILPTSGYLSSGFSNARMHPIHNRALPHEGVDITAPRGTPIMAAAKGRVTFSGRRSGYGLVVEIDHGYGYSTLYGHASELLVRDGQHVERGEVIAQVGRTGIATSPHLHYEVRIGGRPVNPMNYVFTGAIP